MGEVQNRGQGAPMTRSEIQGKRLLIRYLRPVE
jgi:hypothetical protein